MEGARVRGRRCPTCVLAVSVLPSSRMQMRCIWRGTHMGTLALPLASDQECLWLLIGRSREASSEDMVLDGYREPRNVWDAMTVMHP